MNAVIGLPYYGTSVNLILDNEVQYAAVVNMASGNIFSAARGAGLFKDGLPIVRRTRSSKSILATGFAHDRTFHRRQMDMLVKLLEYVDDFRRLASPCLDLCLVAEGVLAGSMEFLKAWDFAAGTLFLDEVGIKHNHSGRFFCHL